MSRRRQLKQLFAASLSPVLLNFKPSRRAASTQHIVRNSLWGSEVENGDSNFWVSKGNSCCRRRRRCLWPRPEA